MKNIKNKISVALITLSVLLGCTNALGETAYRQTAPSADFGYTLFCVGALVSLIWLGVTTLRRTKYIPEED